MIFEFVIYDRKTGIIRRVLAKAWEDVELQRGEKVIARHYLMVRIAR